MKQKLPIILAAIWIGIAALALASEENSSISIIPRPNSIKVLAGHFVLSPSTRILYDAKAEAVARYLSDRLAVPMGAPLPVESWKDDELPRGTIYIGWKELSENSEEYELHVAEDNLVIKAPFQAGLFYAVQSLLQLMPVEVFGDEKLAEVSVPCVEIVDQPSFPWRGYMLDLSRNFFSKETLLRQIDLLALYKINRFHLHLTDDQGWRVEIKKYPLLTKVGAWRRKSEGSEEMIGGFYTQEDLREIVAYAQARQVMIIPEIDVPGHTKALIAAYPELSCRGEPVEVRIEQGVSPDILCPGNENIYDFIAGILDEIIEIFPAPYIHIGGDEAQKGHWLECQRCADRAGAEVGPKSGTEDWDKIIGLQPYFIRRVNDLIRQRGKRMIGWDDIMENSNDEDLKDAIIQSWRSMYPGVKAAERGHQVILSPATTFYLDWPLAWSPIENLYYSAIPDRYWKHFDVKNSDIIGVSCPLWTESVTLPSQVDYLTWPRLLAMAELGWTDRKNRNFRDFKARLDWNKRRFDTLGVNYQNLDGDKLAARWRPEDKLENETLSYDVTGVIDKSGRWKVAFIWESGRGGKKINLAGFEIVQNGSVIASSTRNQTLGYRDVSPVVEVNVVGLDPSGSQLLRLKMQRTKSDRGKPLNSFGSIWFSFEE